MKDKEHIKIQHLGKDYLIFLEENWLPQYIRVLPIKVFGVELGDVSAERIP